MEHIFLFSQLSRKLPSRTVGHSWELVYSTVVHGITLSTLYRNFQGYDSPVLIVVKDEHQKVGTQSGVSRTSQSSASLKFAADLDRDYSYSTFAKFFEKLTNFLTR